ncbi:GNAT family N-acetyltransferase [Thermodesulfobacteriota bacterium]
MDIIDLIKIPEAVPLLAKWHHNQWSYLNPNSSLEKRLEETKLFLCETFIPSTYVAIEENEVLGSAAIVEHDMDTRLEYSPWLASVFVNPKHRNKGVGSKLILHIMSSARKNDLSTLYLFTPDKKNFYKRLGWSTIHTEPFNGVSVSIMNVKFSS